MDTTTGPVAAARRGLVLVAGLLVVVAASTFGLHDLAEAHLGPAAAQHGSD